MALSYTRRNTIKNKAVTIAAITAMTKIINDMHENNQNQLIFSTSSGIVLGDVVSKKEVEAENTGDKIQMLFNGLNHKEINFFELVPLKNVTIMRNDGKNLELPFYVLFIDQISGVSMGNLN